ncbi:hypothetical protein [Amaricoccus solimangrovi]|uniref:Uncharacterized protein n=1 Tax=Amaricoccus solimangrovi TaxID=2589815 RepID=A0A501WRU7_9RHOB|nr:hypothetical protein [Amaricoccus solimangrovi]TPE49731.1 hypothetical protein FJM51_13895 [Amaricoccus solimangrovi]
MLREQNVTALYRRFASADLVREALRNEGLANARIHVIPDRVAGIDDAADLGIYDSVLSELDLPEADTRLYQDAIRRGDFVVSVTVEETDVPKVEEIMRHPEAHADRVDPARYAEQPVTPPEEARPIETLTPMGR